jgi:hypothetical protein
LTNLKKKKRQKNPPIPIVRKVGKMHMEAKKKEE